MPLRVSYYVCIYRRASVFSNTNIWWNIFRWWHVFYVYFWLWPYLLTHWSRVVHICVFQLSIIFLIMACRLVGAWPLSTTMLQYCLLDQRNKYQRNVNHNSYILIQEMHLKISSGKWQKTWWRHQMETFSAAQWTLLSVYRYAHQNASSAIWYPWG